MRKGIVMICNHRRPRGYAPGPIKNEQGMALVTSVLLLLVLGLLVTFSSQWSALDIKRTADYKKSRGAFYVAEAGLQDAINHLNYDAAGNSPGAAKNNFQTALNGNWPVEFTNGISYNGETYTVAIQDNQNDEPANDPAVDGDQTVIAMATGTFKDRTATIEAVLHLPRYINDGAVVVEDSITANGSGDIEGIASSLHSNDSVNLGGSVDIDGGATAVNTCNAGSTSNACNAGDGFYKELPVFEPALFKSYADYLFTATGTIVDQNTGDIYVKSGASWKLDPPGPGPLGAANPELNGFSFTTAGLNPGWGLAGSNLPYDAVSNPSGDIPNNKFLYFEDNFIVNGQLGSAAFPWTVTLVAEKDLWFTGSTYILNCTTCGPDETVQNLFLVAGQDINSQTFELDLTGIIVAKEHIWLGGNVQLLGYVQANNVKPFQSSLVTGNKLSGGFSVTYDTELAAPVTENKVRVLTWREM